MAARRSQSSTWGVDVNPTYFGLLAEFGESEIPLDRVCEKYFGLSIPKAKRRACLQQLPVPVYRTGSQKSPWLVSAIDLANHIDKQRSQAAKTWSSMNDPVRAPLRNLDAR